jgi:L-threonylcarbamoyladenylate synthase
METRLLFARSPQDLDEAAAAILRGGLVAFPTETVYGLGALALDPLAVRGIFAAKGRPSSNPVIVHVRDEEEARGLVLHFPIEAASLAARFWPGPLTLVLPRKALVPDECTAGGETVGVRAPSHPAARALLDRVGAPVAAPSANRSEHVSPTSAAHVLRDLNGRIDAVLDGGRCALGIESTVVALDGRTPRLLRAGAVPRTAIEELIGPLETGGRAHGPLQSPGQHRRHYAPAAQVRIVPAAEIAAAAAGFAGRPKVGALLREAEAPSTDAPFGAPNPGAALSVLRLPADAQGYARELYAALRALEDADCDAIVVEDVPHSAEWDAIRDRLLRASAR